MVTEEIELNAALEADGRTVVETDLGEFIVQISGDRPSHIVAPVLHWTRQEVGRLFADELSVSYTEEPTELKQIARTHLRRIFLEADMGISGVNFAAASTGTIAVVTNEGNGRLTTTAPRVHVAVIGMERVVPTLEDVGVMLEVLGRSATGQSLTTYTNLITGPRRSGDPTAQTTSTLSSWITAGRPFSTTTCPRCWRVSGAVPA
jgi:L-lactate dehydrogenase complex protein LldF